MTSHTNTTKCYLYSQIVLSAVYWQYKRWTSIFKTFNVGSHDFRVVVWVFQVTVISECMTLQCWLGALMVCMLIPSKCKLLLISGDPFITTEEMYLPWNTAKRDGLNALKCALFSLRHIYISIYIYSLFFYLKVVDFAMSTTNILIIDVNLLHLYKK